jgi:putative FmdB family regulatory protein
VETGRYPEPVPVYEYRCSSCGRTMEEIQPMGSGPPGPCPECGGELRRVYGRVGVRFAGWGFSRTDGLLPGDRPRRDFRALKDKAEELTDSD